ncbi:MAG: hypothetical protein CXR30_18250 [Geobacter sp.]|nr:MAG: hypothetical protein CXR30_18250 [Geobacter sp.]
MKNRAFTRAKFSKNATITVGGQTIGGQIENISLRGLFVQTKHQIPLNSSVEVSVQYSKNSSLDLKATVVRHEAEAGLGMRINRMDIPSLIYLRNLVTVHCGDQNRVMDETKKMVSYMIS